MARFRLAQYRNASLNNAFSRANPSVSLPPDYLLYESFQSSYRKYYEGGLEAAEWVADHLSRHSKVAHKNVLDWGCGPGRLLRHMPAVLGPTNRYYGTDYNPASIAWCEANLTGIAFNLNGLAAKLPYSDGQMDAIYGISIFTHLSAQSHYDWRDELTRVLSPGGVLLLTLHGKNYRSKLSKAEQQTYDAGDLVTKGNTTEGHRTYAAYHPPAFVRQLFRDLEILEHLELTPELGKSLPQDVWLFRKR